MTKLVLVNAIYFKGNWDNKFDKEKTREMPFHISKNEERPVQMMFKKSVFEMTYVKEISTQILVLPYVKKELSLIIMLPDKNTNLNMVEKELSYEKFLEWTRPDNLYKRELEFFFPRFKLEETYDMEDVLCDLGMVDAFDEGRADFSGMTSERELYLSKVMHKSFVEVTEEGTEAAAATGVIIRPLSALTPTFCADRPFLFFIQHNKIRGILFCGRLSSP